MKTMILICTLYFLGCGSNPDWEVAGNQLSNNQERKKKNKNDCHADMKCYKKCYKSCAKLIEHDQKDCKKTFHKCQKEASKLYLDWLKGLEDQLEFCEDTNQNHTDVFNCIQNVIATSPNQPTTTFETCWVDYDNCMNAPIPNFSTCLIDCACVL